MDQLLTNIPAVVQALSLGLTSLTILATVVVRLTPSKTDDLAVGKFSSKLMAMLRWLPTLGVNPQTKKLEEALYELKEEKTNPGV